MDYPTGLPAPLRAGYGINPENNIIRTQMVSGRARQRVAYTSVPAYADLSWLFTAQQAQTFESWSAGQGGDWFNIKLKTPLGYYNQECRFMESPSGPDLVGINLWSYKAKVEIKNRVIVDPGYGEFAPDYILMADIFDRTMNGVWPI